MIRILMTIGLSVLSINMNSDLRAEMKSVEGKLPGLDDAHIGNLSCSQIQVAIKSLKYIDSMIFLRAEEVEGENKDADAKLQIMIERLSKIGFDKKC